MAGKSALVVGVTGLVGLGLAEELLAQGWKVWGTSRRGKPNYLPQQVQHISMDLTDSTQMNLVSLGVEVSRVFYCAVVNTVCESHIYVFRRIS